MLLLKKNCTIIDIQFLTPQTIGKNNKMWGKLPTGPVVVIVVASPFSCTRGFTINVYVNNGRFTSNYLKNYAEQ